MHKQMYLFYKFSPTQCYKAQFSWRNHICYFSRLF